MQINLPEAGAELSELVRSVLNGERVMICQDGTPLVELVRSEQASVRTRKFGTMKGRIVIHDPNWHKGPETDEELEA